MFFFLPSLHTAGHARLVPHRTSRERRKDSRESENEKQHSKRAKENKPPFFFQLLIRHRLPFNTIPPPVSVLHPHPPILAYRPLPHLPFDPTARSLCSRYRPNPLNASLSTHRMSTFRSRVVRATGRRAPATKALSIVPDRRVEGMRWKVILLSAAEATTRGRSASKVLMSGRRLCHRC